MKSKQLLNVSKYFMSLKFTKVSLLGKCGAAQLTKK